MVTIYLVPLTLGLQEEYQTRGFAYSIWLRPAAQGHFYFEM